MSDIVKNKLNVMWEEKIGVSIGEGGRGGGVFKVELVVVWADRVSYFRLR